MPDNSAPPVMDPQQPPWHDRRRCGGSARSSWAITLILFGIVLFLSNIGILPIHNVWGFWPLYLLIPGIGQVVGGNPTERKSGVILIILGFFFLASNEHWFSVTGRDFTGVIGLILVVIGFFGIQAAREGAGPLLRARQIRRHARQFSTGSWQVHNPTNPFNRPDEWLRDSAIFGGIKRRVETNGFTGGNIESVFGSLELDLRNIAMPPLQPAATLHVNCVFGAIKLRVPQHWRISMQVGGAFGAAEDKTVPMPRNDLPAATLVITGSNAFGAVEVDN